MKRPVATALLAFCLLAACGGGKRSADGYPIIGSVEILKPGARAYLSEDTVVEKLTGDRFGWSEGPVVMEERGAVFFTDVPGNTLHRWSEEDGLSTFLEPAGLEGPVPDEIREAGANGLVADGPDGILMADHGNRAIVRLDLATKEKTFLATEYEGQRFSSPNDLVRAANGRIYFTDPPYGFRSGDESPLKEMEVNGVYLLRPEGDVVRIEEELSRPNGVALSPDEEVLYVAQSVRGAAELYAYDLDDDGLPTGRRTLFDFTPLVGSGALGMPDGMAIASDGTIFQTGPGGVHLLSPGGEHLGVIRTGVAVSNAALNADESVLYLTSSAFLARVVLNEG